MTSEAVKAGAPTDAGLRSDVQSNTNSSENILDTLRAQYLAEIFALPASTAVTIAELAFGEQSHA
jgi:hypothetical protein